MTCANSECGEEGGGVTPADNNFIRNTPYNLADGSLFGRRNVLDRVIQHQVHEVVESAKRSSYLQPSGRFRVLAVGEWNQSNLSSSIQLHRKPLFHVALELWELGLARHFERRMLYS